MRSKFKINGKEIQIIINTGSTTSVITDKLRRKLKLKIQKPSKEIFRIANGKLITSLGELEIRVEFEGEEVLIKTQVIESREEVLLVGIECLDKLKVKINFEEKFMEIITPKKRIRILIQYQEKIRPGIINLVKIEKKERKIKMGNLSNEQKEKLEKLLEKYETITSE